MNITLAKNWWALVIRGLVGILFALLTFAWPAITFSALVFVFAAYALVDGVMSLTGAVKAVGAHDRWGALVLEGLAGILTAIITMAWPAITGVALVFVIAAWAVVTGIFQVVAAVRLRKYIEGEWLLALSGIISTIFGIAVMLLPAAGALAIALWVGVYAFVSGVLLIALGLRLRSWGREHFSGPPYPMPAH